MCSGGPWGLVADSLVAVDAAVPAPGGDRHHGRGDKRGEVAEPGTRVTELVVTATESRPLSWTVTLPRSPAWDSVPSVSGEAGASGTGVPSLTSGTMVALPGPWAAPVGLKCPPADSNGVSPSTSQTPVSWICSPCSPGGRFETVMVRLRAPSDSEPITVPIWSPSVLRTPTAEIDDRDVAGVASWAVAKPMLARARTPAQVAMRGVRQEENPPELVRAAVICPPESREHAIRVPLVLRFWPARYWHPPDRVEKPGQNIDARRCLALVARRPTATCGQGANGSHGTDQARSPFLPVASGLSTGFDLETQSFRERVVSREIDDLVTASEATVPDARWVDLAELGVVLA